MNTSKSFFPNRDNTSVTPNSSGLFSSTPIPASQPLTTVELLAITLPAFDFYHLGMGVTTIQLPINEDVFINGMLIPAGSIANIRFEYTGAFSKTIGGHINLLEMSLESIIVDGQIILIHSSVPNLGDFADPNEQYIIVLSTTARLEVPIETTIVFEILKVSI